MPGAIPLRASLIHLAETIPLRDPIAAARTAALGRDEGVRADAVGAGVFAFHLHAVSMVGDLQESSEGE